MAALPCYVKLCVQFDQDPDWTEVYTDIAFTEWTTITRPIVAVNCQGVVLEAFDSYHAAPTSDGYGGIEVYAWREGDGVVWRFWPLSQDDRLGGAINTDQECAPWNAAPPADSKAGRIPTAPQRASRRPVGWREFADHLPAEEVDDNGALLEQRCLGRYATSERTRTYYLSTTDRAFPGSNVLNENALQTATSTSGTESVTLLTLSEDHVFSWITSNEPMVLDWPNGSYRCQLDVTVAGSDVSYSLGVPTLGIGVEGGFARVDGAGTLEKTTQSQLPFSGTGLKLASATWNPAAGGNTDHYGIVVAARNNSAVTSQSLTFRMGGADSFADGPWTHKSAALPLSLLGVGQ